MAASPQLSSLVLVSLLLAVFLAPACKAAAAKAHSPPPKKALLPHHPPPKKAAPKSPPKAAPKPSTAAKGTSACKVILNNKFLGNGCAAPLNTCLVTKVDVNPSVPLSGVCASTASLGTHCTSSGPIWGPLYYAAGTSQVIQPGNFCNRCQCSSSGQITGCKAIPGCSMCILPVGSRNGPKCAACCLANKNLYYRQRCIEICERRA